MRKFEAKNAKKFDFRKAKIVKRKKTEIFGLHFFSLMRSENFKAKINAKNAKKIFFIFALNKRK